mmetsp:Transcript_17924/g.36865  ORF Transcript_17924/g.36865 Transcript_17924/m.36865 type:complete len:86 (-) Transcript_17924:693-950(-)
MKMERKKNICFYFSSRAPPLGGFVGARGRPGSAHNSRSKTLEAVMLGICFRPLSLRELVALTLKAPGPPMEWLVHSREPWLEWAS